MKSSREGLFYILQDSGFTPFEIQVYRTVSSIPWGETRSYAHVAEMMGRPGSQRAVGRALHKNPYPFIIPCHRVIRSDGSLGGFSCGVELKKRLLKAEKADIIGHKIIP